MPLLTLLSQVDTSGFPIASLTICGPGGTPLQRAHYGSQLELRVQQVTYEDPSTGVQGYATDNDTTVYASIGPQTDDTQSTPQQLTYQDPADGLPAGTWTGVLDASLLPRGIGRWRVTAYVYGPRGLTDTLRETKQQIVTQDNP